MLTVADIDMLLECMCINGFMGIFPELSKTISSTWPAFYLSSSLLKLSKLWDPNFSFNYLKQIHFYLNVLRTYLGKEIRFLKSAPYLTWTCLRRL